MINHVPGSHPLVCCRVAGRGVFMAYQRPAFLFSNGMIDGMRVAQLVERWSPKPQVASSNLVAYTFRAVV